MGRRRSLALSGLVGLLVAGCSLLSPPDPRLCSAAQNLSAAMALTATAIEADATGDLARAQGLATQARSITELASSLLQSMPRDQQQQPVWQALSQAYTQTGQAANSLLPAYSGTHGLGPAQLERATSWIAKARADLPAMCFDIPADIETPRST